MASLKSFVVEGNLAQEGLSTNGAGTTVYGGKGTLNANLPEGVKAKLKISDKTLSSLANNLSIQPEDASVEFSKDDTVTLGYNLQTQQANAKLSTKQKVADRELGLSAEWKQKDNSVLLQAVHELDSKTTLTANYNTNGGDVNVKAKYVIDDSTIEAEAKVTGGVTWKASVVHKLSKQDEIKAAVNGEKVGEPKLTYTRRQDGMELSLCAPVSSNIAADARFKITRTFEL